MTGALREAMGDAECTADGRRMAAAMHAGSVDAGRRMAAAMRADCVDAGRRMAAAMWADMRMVEERGEVLRG